MPHPLTVTSLKMMWSSITPHIDAIEVIVELLVVEEEQPHREDEMKIILIGFLAIAEEVDILSHALTVADIFQHDDTILYNRGIT